MPTTTTESEARAKADVYAFLAQVFNSGPTEERVRVLCAMAAELGIECPGGLSLNDLAREYMELFVIPNPRYIAPYESVFRDEWPLPEGLPRGSNPSETGQKIKGLLMGESTLKVRDCYLRAGIFPERELPDHVSNELLFVAHTFQREAEAVNGSAAALSSVRDEFLCEHLLAWIVPLRERLLAREQLGFYRAAIEVVAAVLREEGDLVEPVRPAASAVSQGPGCPWHGQKTHHGAS